MKINVRTYEILAKWIGKQCNATVKFVPGATPKANMQTNEITLGTGSGNLALLSDVWHEGAHLRYTKIIPKDLITCPVRFSLLNAVEDIRIDLKNLAEFRNVQMFYEHGVDRDLEMRKTINVSGIPFHLKVMINTIYDMEGFMRGKFKSKVVEKFRRDNSINWKTQCIIDAIEGFRWKEVKSRIEELYNLFNLKSKDNFKTEKIMRGGEGLSKDDTGTQEGSNQGCGAVALQQMTRQRFKELLNVEEKVTVNKGNELNTDNLLAYFTEDIDELFKQENIVTKKKSKVFLLLDSSGSMMNPMLDGQRRLDVVANCTQSLINILEEVKEIEGININYAVSKFAVYCTHLTKSNWRKEYSAGGNTDIVEGFTKMKRKIDADNSITGNKILIIFTDGKVEPEEIAKLKAKLNDIKCMIIGVGAELNGSLVRNIVGDRNILAEEYSEEILLESVMEMI